MGRTSHQFYRGRYGHKLGYVFKSRRSGLNKKLNRAGHNSHRNDNRFADHINFNTFNNGKYRNLPHHNYKSGQLMGNRFNAYIDLKDLFTKWSPQQTLSNLINKITLKIRQLFYRKDSCNYEIGSNKQRTRHVSDLYIAVKKQLQRRGAIGRFRGHRDNRQLYKRELYF